MPKFPYGKLDALPSKVYLKTKKMTNISQAQAGFKAKSRRNPLWISRLFNAKSSCVCRNRLNFRLFRYTLACCSNAAPIRASCSVGQSGRLITARPYRFYIFQTAFFRCFLVYGRLENRTWVFSGYESCFTELWNNIVRAISLMVKARGS